MRISLQYTLIAHRYLYDNLKILHCNLSVSNVLLNRKDDESEPVGLLIDYDYSESVGADDTHSFGGSLLAEAKSSRTQRLTVRFSQSLEMFIN